MTSTAELSSPSSANTDLTNSVLDPDYTLEHKYTRQEGRIYLSGVQALVRLPLMQRLRDQAAGLNTAGFISGYRGSPLGGFDLELWRARKHLEAAGVKFTPGLNEDLGATMNDPSAPPRPPFPLARWALIALAVGGLAGAFAYVAGYLDPQRLTPARVVDQLQTNGGLHPGYRRNHAKGVCVIGRFDSSGAAAAYSRAAVFAAGASTPLVGRFALPGGNPYAPDGGVPIRSFALRLTQPDGQQWRTGMTTPFVGKIGRP